MRRLPILALLLGVFSLLSCHHNAAPASTAITCTTTSSTTTTTSSSSCTDPTTGITIAISPTTVSVTVGTPTQFQAGVSGGTNSIVKWQVNGIPSGNDMVGRIDASGKYIAPITVPSTKTVNVIAVSYEDPKLSVTSVATIVAPPTVTISPTCTPTPCTLTSGSANQMTFTGTVTGAATTLVDYQVNGILGGNATFGTITAAGVYTAPNTPPIGSTVTVMAVSHDSPSSSASAPVTISGYSTSSFQGQFAFSMAGSNASGAFFRAGSFVADGAGRLSTGLEDVNAASCAATNPISFVGTYMVSADGRGTMTFADSCTPSTFSFVLVNNNQLQITGFDTSGTATGQANLQDPTFFNAAGLIGTYVFDFAGVHGVSPLSEIGEFTSDGLGKITGGLRDTNDGGAISSQVPFTGSYVVYSNGRGTATLGSLNFSFYIVSRGSAKFVGVDPQTTVGGVAGVASQQSPNATFDATALNGNLVFSLAGPLPNGTLATAGSFSADGNLHITAGVLDENVSGTATQNMALSNGSYTVASNGRGTATFTTVTHTYNLVFYLSAPGNAVLQETDSGRTSDGSFVQQQALLSIAVTPTNPSVVTRKTQQFAATATFSDNSTLDLTNSVVWGSGTTAVATINSSGLASALQVGTSTISATVGSVTGVTTLTVTAAMISVPATPASQSIVGGEPQQFATIQQQTTAFSLASIQGSYALQTTGLSSASPAAAQTIAGPLVANGAGAISSGTIDINSAGTPASETATGTYSLPASNGRATLILNPSTDNRNFAVYIVNSTQVFVIGIDAGRLASGAMYKRF